jgi:hypothetical protein
MKTMIFRRDWLALMLTMTDEAAGVFIKEIAAFTFDPSEDRETRIDDPKYKVSYDVICQQLLESYKEFIARRAFDELINAGERIAEAKKQIK